MDTISLRIDPDLYVSWPNGGGFQQVEIRINDLPLIEIVRELELPFAFAEWDERTAKGETADNIGERGWWAGNYLICRIVKRFHRLVTSSANRMRMDSERILTIPLTRNRFCYLVLAALPTAGSRWLPLQFDQIR